MKNVACGFIRKAITQPIKRPCHYIGGIMGRHVVSPYELL